jgi:urea transport system permease protein
VVPIPKLEWFRVRKWLSAVISALALILSVPSWALDPETAFKMAAGDNNDRIAAIRGTVADGDPTVIPFLEELLDGNVKVTAARAFISDGTSATDPGTGAPVALPAGAQDVVNNNRVRTEIRAALAVLQLLSSDKAVRKSAAQSLRTSDVDKTKLTIIEKAIAAETDSEIRELLIQLRSAVQLSDEDPHVRLAAARALGQRATPATRELLLTRLGEGVETDLAVRAALDAAVKSIERRMMVYDYVARMFTGISLGSILLLAALGLAITYGLMGIINMAHGELIMIGAYATYVVQTVFRTYMPDLFQFYPVAAIPVAFLVAALVGIAIERSVLQFLYGRSLETLLATWGVSLILMQAVRTLFGAQNVEVENPVWMSGSMILSDSLVLPYNRIVIIFFSVGVVTLMWWLLTRTRLGLFVRAVTQNRTMAGCIGVPTKYVDTMAFGLGSGIAGLAGVALSQIGNVGPDLGQQYIVKSFMVVVLGGVGQLAGSVLAALGLGVISKFTEGLTGPVIAEISLLVFVIIFIQRRPQGLFALSGRSAE